MNNRNVDILRIAKIKNTSSSLIANTAMQVTTAHDQRYSTFKMAAEVIKKHQRQKKTKNTFSRGCEQAKVTTQVKKKWRHPIVSCSVISTLPISHHSSTQEMNHCVLFFFTALPRTIAPAPLLRLRDNYADRRQETVYYLFFLTQISRELQMYI